MFSFRLVSIFCKKAILLAYIVILFMIVLIKLSSMMNTLKIILIIPIRICMLDSGNFIVIVKVNFFVLTKNKWIIKKNFLTNQTWTGNNSFLQRVVIPHLTIVFLIKCVKDNKKKVLILKGSMTILF